MGEAGIGNRGQGASPFPPFRVLHYHGDGVDVRRSMHQTFSPFTFCCTSTRVGMDG